MGSPPERPDQDIDRYLQSLWVRSAVIHAVRALCAAGGVFASVLLVMALTTGPVVGVGLSRSLLAVAGLCAIAAGIWAALPLRRVGSANRHRLLGARSPTLASHARSALQLAKSAEAGSAGSASTSLIAAHAASVRTAVLAAPPSEAVPWRGLKHTTTLAGLFAFAFATAIFAGSEAARTGARALLTPATIGKSGVRVARIVDGVRASLTFPSYLERAQERVSEVTQLAVPRGTTVELSVRPVVPARHGAVVIGEEVVRLAQGPNGVLTGKLVARTGGALALRVLHDEVWYEDNEARALVVQDDRAPEVKLTAGPMDGAIVQLTDTIGLAFEATDDHGLATVELALRLPSGEETRQRLWSSIGQKPTGQLASQAEIAMERLGVRPGDIVLAWIEARDADVVSGPHVGASRAVTLEVATDAQELSLQIPALRAVLDSALDVLAVRLELPVPDAALMARQRFEELREATDAWLVMLDQLIESSGRAEPADLDVDQLRGIADRTRRELGREATAYEGTPPGKRMVDADARMVAEQERDVLLLADMLASALVDEARALTNELNAIKEHMRELLEKLKKAPSAEAKRELLAELAKAQRRLRDLAQSLSRLSQRVPSEFINREAIPQSDAKGSMESLQAAIEAGDMAEAERQLEALSQQIDQLAQHVDQGGARFRESRFGEHDKQVAQARNQLSMLAAEQERLAGRSREVVQDAARRAQARSQQQGQDSSGMQQLAQGAQSDLDTLGQPNGNSSDGQLLGQARERTRDVADALRTGDLAEARRMSAAAQRSLDSLARSLDHDAQMFPGHQGETRERAQAAADAAGKLRRLQEQLDQAMPPLDDFMGDDERAKLRGDAPQQRSARELAEKLGSQMGQETEGTPISPDAQRGLQEVSESMRRAEQALGQGDADEASRSQEEAADRLRQIEQAMAQKGKGQGGKEGERQRQGGEGREGEEGNGRNSDGPVRIPGADEFTGPVEMRRRVLDAMREEGPSGFESALQRYYEGLLR